MIEIELPWPSLVQWPQNSCRPGGKPRAQAKAGSRRGLKQFSRGISAQQDFDIFCMGHYQENLQTHSVTIVPSLVNLVSVKNLK